MQPMYYVLIIFLVVFFVAYLCYHIKKNKKKDKKPEDVKRSLIMVGEDLVLPLPFFFGAILLFDILPPSVYPFAVVVSLAVILLMGYLRRNYHDMDVVVFTFFAFCLIGMLEKNLGLSLGVAIAVGVFVLILIVSLYIYIFYFTE